jgi:hypothetical protein
MAVMMDLARVTEEVGGAYIGVNDENAIEVIRELAELPERKYRRALSTLKKVGRIYQIGTSILERSSTSA